MKRIVIGLMMFCGSLILEGSSGQLSESQSSLQDGLPEAEDYGIPISESDAPVADVQRSELLLSSSPRQIFAQGLRSVVGLFTTPPPLEEYDSEAIKETHKMRNIILENNETGAELFLKKVGPTCAERLIDGIAPIHMVSFPKDRVSMLQILMKGGVSVETKTQGGETPLQIALMRGNQPVAQALIVGGAEFGEAETKILETLSADDTVVRELTTLLGKARQDRLVTQVTETRERLEVKKKQEGIRQTLDQKFRAESKRRDEESQTASHASHDEYGKGEHSGQESGNEEV